MTGEAPPTAAGLPSPLSPAFLAGYSAGYEHGHQAGYAEAEADMAARWHAAADPIAAGGPSFAELERRRWGPGGREHFGDPRPGDFPGREGGSVTPYARNKRLNDSIPVRAALHAALPADSSPVITSRPDDSIRDSIPVRAGAGGAR